MSDVALSDPLQQGAQFPDFELLDQDRKYNFLEDLMDGGLLIAFLPKLTAAASVQKILELETEQPSLKKAQIATVGICSETPAKLLNFSENYFLSFPLLFDEDSKLAHACGLLTVEEFLGKEFLAVSPTLFLVNRHRAVCATHSVATDSEEFKDWLCSLPQTLLARTH